MPSEGRFMASTWGAGTKSFSFTLDATTLRPNYTRVMHRPDHARLTGDSLAEDNGLLARGDRAGYVGPDLQCCGPRGKALKAQIKKRKLVNSLFLLGSPSARLYQGEYLAFPRTPSMANVRVAEDRPGGLLPVSRWSWNQILNAQLAADARMDLCGVEYVDGLAGEMPWTRAHETQNSVLSIRVRGGKITPVPCARVTDACAMSSPVPQDRLVGPHQAQSDLVHDGRMRQTSDLRSSSVPGLNQTGSTRILRRTCRAGRKRSVYPNSRI